MRTASVSELKVHLSRFLQVVRRGAEVLVLERGTPVARLVAVGPGEARTRRRRDRLLRAGVLRPGTGDLSWVLRESPLRVRGVTVSEALQDEREDRV